MVAISNMSVLFSPLANNANISCCCEDWTCSFRHGKGADATYCMLGGWLFV